MNALEPLHGLPGLNGLHLAGQWTTHFSGTVMAAASGRQVIQLMCKKEGKKFATKVNRTR